jgi:hypothetical protein
MAQHMRWQFGSSLLPAEADAAAKLSVPYPAHEPRQALYHRTIRQFNRTSSSFTVVGLLCDEANRVALDLLGLLFRRPARKLSDDQPRFSAAK